jgi:hypothetical protein
MKERSEVLAECSKGCHDLSKRLVGLARFFDSDLIPRAVDELRTLFYALRMLEEKAQSANRIISDVPCYVYCRNCQKVVTYLLINFDLCCNGCHCVIATFHADRPAPSEEPDSAEIASR